MGREHVLDGSTTHHDWRLDDEPLITIESADLLHVAAPFGGDPGMHAGSTLADIDLDAFTYRLVGPVAVAGAEPGDTLEVELLNVTTDDWGYTIVLPGLGLLSEDFPEPFLKTWRLAGGRAELRSGVAVPLEPFLGTLGTHPGQPAVADPLPPHRGGGNIDNRHLAVGSRVWLPVWCDGARFSCGDGHAAQGDGEVCVSAIECSVRATLRLRLHKRRLSAPRFEAVGPHGGASRGGRYHGTMGIADDLMEGARIAVRAMIEWLVEERGLDAEEAYVLCSVAGDLKILEIVDAGVWNVGFTLPLAVFGEK